MGKIGMTSAGSGGTAFYVVSSENLQDQGDELHFNAESCVKLGQRYGNKLLSHLESFACKDLKQGDSSTFQLTTWRPMLSTRDDRVMGGKSHSALLYEDP